MVTFNRGALNSPQVVTVETFKNESEAERMTGGNKVPGQALSDYVHVDDFAASATLEMPVNGIADNAKIYRANARSQWAYLELDTRAVNGMAVASTSEGGVFVVAQEQVAIYVSVFTVVLIIAVLVVAIGGVGIYFKCRPEKWQATKSKLTDGATNLKRSFADKV